MKTITLTNGIKIPTLGFGTFQITDPTEVENSVIAAIKAGYQHIDTAQSYMNEEAVGLGIKHSGVSREDIFVTTKIWVENTTYEGVHSSFKDSLNRLDMDYVDLLLLHQPYNDTFGAWRAMEELLEQGKVRSIGVSNFSADQVINLAAFNEVTPYMNQIEVNPFHQQSNYIELLKEEEIVPEVWAPFAEGKNNFFENETLEKIGKKYNKSVAQVVLRWLIEQDLVVLAKTVRPERMKENLDIFDFSLDDEDRELIKSLDQQESQFFDHKDPEIIKNMSTRTLDF